MSNPDRAQSGGHPETRADRWLLALLLAATALYLWDLRPYGLMLLDEGYVVHAAQRMLGGELLYRDIYAHYAPLLYHALALAFAITGPSMLVSRTVYLSLLLVNVALTDRLARRFVGPVPALIPAALVALMPGQWSKAPVGFSIGIVLLAGARALESPGALRFLVLGLVSGLALSTRQDVGAVMLGFALAVSPLPALLPQRFGLGGARSLSRAARETLLTAAGAAVVPGAFAAWYAAQGGLAALVNATLLRAFTQRGAYGFDLPALLASGGVSPEGRLAGAILLAPLVILCVAGVVWALLLRKRGLDANTTLVAGLLAAGLAALSNVYYQLRVLRVLESAMPYWLLATWLLAGAAHAAARRWPGAAGRRASTALLAAGVAAAALLVWAVESGIPRIDPGDEYTGSRRAKSYREPVTVLGDTLYVGWLTRDEIRCLRSLVEAEVPPGEPIFVAPLSVLYYSVLERPNPLWMLIGDFLPGDYLMTDTEKSQEMQRLLASPTRIALVDGFWLAAVRPPDAIRRTLLESFHPARRCGSTLVLERGPDPGSLPMLEIAFRAGRGQATAADLRTMQEIAARRSGDAFPHEVLGRVLIALGRKGEAVPELESAARLDPGNPEPLELAAELLLAQGRRQDAAAVLTRAEAVRESPTTQALRQRLGPISPALR